MEIYPVLHFFFWNLTTAAPPIISYGTSKVMPKISVHDLMTISRVLLLIIGQNDINPRLLQPIVVSICKVMTVKKPCVRWSLKNLPPSSCSETTSLWMAPKQNRIFLFLNDSSLPAVKKQKKGYEKKNNCATNITLTQLDRKDLWPSYNFTHNLASSFYCD